MSQHWIRWIRCWLILIVTVSDMIIMNKRFIGSLDSFKEFMLSDDVPNYVVRYCKHLNEIKWIWFYAQMVEAVIITDELDYLFYMLKWILKTDFHDLAYEMYFYDMTDPECRPESLIQDKYWDMYSAHYLTRFMQDMSISQ
ncbi:hypothetical protein [Anaerocolumna sp.]|uniref:hypothetical protein n=1 Tax=Anaerocolumna sp. TaxID=2041569 RepID=UPI0028B09551|nr:hypothetical protein [Anaerocolumna sp.]